MNPVEAEYIKGKEYTISSSEDLGFSPRVGYKLLHWKDINSEKTYQPNEKITIYDDTFGLSAVWKEYLAAIFLAKDSNNTIHAVEFDNVGPKLQYRDNIYPYIIKNPYQQNKYLSVDIKTWSDEISNLIAISDPYYYFNSIGDYSFYNCTSLVSVDCHNVSSIGYNAFNSCKSLISIDCRNVSSIGNYAFQDCTSLVSIDCHDVSSIDYNAFNNCKSLTSIDCHNVSSIGYNAFNSCKSLISIDCDNIKIIKDYAFDICESLISIDCHDVSSIDNYIFEQCTSLTSIDCPNISSIGNHAFYNCKSLASINCHNIKFIKDYAFDTCESLISIDCHDVSSIGIFAFCCCSSLTSMYCPNIKSIGQLAFQRCKSLVSVDCHDVSSIGNEIFNSCTSLTSIDCPNISSIGNYAFYDCRSLISIDCHDVSSIGNYAFGSCAMLKSIILSGITDIENVTKIKNTSLIGCSKNISVYVHDDNMVTAFQNAENWKDYYTANKVDFIPCIKSLDEPLHFTATQDESTIELRCLEWLDDGEAQPVPIKVALQYSFDNIEWNTWDGSTITLANEGDKVYIKAAANNGAYCTTDITQECEIGDYVHNFKFTGKIEATGSVQYLLDPTGKRTDVPEYAFVYLFLDEDYSGALSKAPDLPATTLAKCCYTAMFIGNNSLSKAPDLPANVAPYGCYKYMFMECDSFSEPVKISATSFDDYSCYSTMTTLDLDAIYHFTNMTYNNMKSQIENNEFIFGDEYEFNAKCSDGIIYRFSSEELYEYQLTGTNVYYYGDYDGYSPSTTIVGTVTSTSEQLKDHKITVKFNGASEIGEFDDSVEFEIITNNDIEASIGESASLNMYSIGAFNYYDFNESEKDVWLKLPIEKVEE